MDVQVLAPVIAASAAVLLGLWNAWWTSKQNQKNREAQTSLADGQRAANEDLEVLKERDRPRRHLRPGCRYLAVTPPP
jgi:hypothetical protein